MKKILFVSFCIALTTLAKSQELSADKLFDMLSFPASKVESQLLNKKYRFTGNEFLGDTLIKRYEYRPARYGKKRQQDSVSRTFLRSSLKETFTLTYQTTSATEYNGIMAAIKKDGFICEYEKDSTLTPNSYLYQHEDYTADASIKKVDNINWYSITLHKKIFILSKDIHFAEDLLDFTSHEYLVYYFGEKNVKKDVYYFAQNDIVKCSVLFINSKRQAVFIWKDGLNRRGIDNVLIGGQHKLKSQEGSGKFIAENDWLLKSGVHAGMPLFELRSMNEKNFAFCGGDAPNPGLITSESSGKIDFKNADIILGCMNCTDDKFLATKIFYADKAIEDGRILFVLTIVLYPLITGVFD